MLKIVAIGGGGPGRQTARIGREIVRLTGRRRPRVLVIPTASKDNPDSITRFHRAFRAMGCEVDELLCIRARPSGREIREKVRQADAIFVGGGNTLMMMRRWAFLGVDRELLAAGRRGAVLAGGSAGAICWCEYGHSDSERGYGHDPWEYIRVRGLGLIRGTLCPHYHHTDRREDFLAMIARKGGFGVALDDRTALEVVDDRWRILAETRRAGAWVVTRRRGGATERAIPIDGRFRPLPELYAL